MDLYCGYDYLRKHHFVNHEGFLAAINLETVDPICAETGLNFTPNTAVKKPVRAALANSFGFGGTNASIVVSAP